MENLKELEEFKEFESLFELSNYGMKTTGLPMMIWIGPKGKAKHGPRIKVQRTYVQKMDSSNLFSVTISNDPTIIAGDQGEISNKDLELVYDWIILNQNILLDMWDEKFVDFDDFKQEIKKLIIQ